MIKNFADIFIDLFKVLKNFNSKRINLRHSEPTINFNFYEGHPLVKYFLYNLFLSIQVDKVSILIDDHNSKSSIMKNLLKSRR